MVQIHSPRPFLLEPVIYRQTYSRRPPGVGPGGLRFRRMRRPLYVLVAQSLHQCAQTGVFCTKVGRRIRT
jgi:hypothetical protein